MRAVRPIRRLSALLIALLVPALGAAAWGKQQRLLPACRRYLRCRNCRRSCSRRDPRARVKPPRAMPGEIWLDANLLDAGSFAWGVIQHEYAHQVDFFLLTAAARVLLLGEFGGSNWCTQGAGLSTDLGCERFASTLAWAYWPSADNCMHPATRPAISPARFRHLLSELIGEEEG